MIPNKLLIPSQKESMEGAEEGLNEQKQKEK